MSRVQARLRALPSNVRGALWMLLAALSFSTMDACIKLLGQHMHALEIAFFRCVFGGLAVVPFVLRAGVGILRTGRWGGHLARGLTGYTAMALGFYAVTHLPLADATALSFTRPLFTIVLAVIFLHEIVRWRRWTATIVGFAGVVIMVRPGVATIDVATVAAATSALFVAAVGVQVKRLATTERPETIIFYFTLISSLLSLGPALYVWRTPTPLELGGLMLIGGLGSLGQYFTIRSYRLAEATAVDPVDYARLVFATFYGFVLFGNLPDRWTIAGALVIVASTLYITRREAKLRRPVTAGTAMPGAPVQISTASSVAPSDSTTTGAVSRRS
ncbi:MAG TPA: DMT family transporter [Alphaproteobacteria bacterium]